MSGERLEDIKVKVNNTKEPMLYIPYDDVVFLIEQAELVEGSIKLINFHQELQKKAEDKNEPYRHQNKRYRDATKKAISHFNQDEHHEGMSVLQKILRGESE